MIHDKDYIIRIVKQFSEFLSKLLLEKNEAELIEKQRIFDTNMNDTFKMTFDELASKSTEEILDIVQAKDEAHQVPYLELLGHIFFLKNVENNKRDYALKAKIFYEHYLQKSGVFSMPIFNRINELKTRL